VQLAPRWPSPSQASNRARGSDRRGERRSRRGRDDFVDPALFEAHPFQRFVQVLTGGEQLRALGERHPHGLDAETTARGPSEQWDLPAGVQLAKRRLVLLLSRLAQGDRRGDRIAGAAFAPSGRCRNAG
jgi:hypothetical protein